MLHGHAQRHLKKNGVYAVWCNMKARCDNPKHPVYKYYGARGIGYDPRWSEFSEFHADVGDQPEGLSLDRVDNSKGYWPDNVRWATKQEQMRNTRRNRKITAAGETLILSEWAKRLGVDPRRIDNRIRLGWTDSDAVLTPVRKKRTQ